MSKTGLKVTKDIMADVLKQIRSLTKSEVLIGIPDENAGRYPRRTSRHDHSLSLAFVMSPTGLATR
jgi:hypothetical protein